MYPWINLGHVAGGTEVRPTDTSEPANYSDSLSNGKHCVFVHGYSVHEEGARAWNAEIFKRVYQSSSQAMFAAVLWCGNEAQIPDRISFIGGTTPDYYSNVKNALQTATSLVAALSSLPVSKYIAAHSLGNMVVSSAISGAGLSVNAYFMINAAVAMETYDSGANNRDDMRHPHWQNYSNLHLWASEWHQLFPKNDGSANLAWR